MTESGLCIHVHPVPSAVCVGQKQVTGPVPLRESGSHMCEALKVWTVCHTDSGPCLYQLSPSRNEHGGGFSDAAGI